MTLLNGSTQPEIASHSSGSAAFAVCYGVAKHPRVARSRAQNLLLVIELASSYGSCCSRQHRFFPLM